MTHRLPIRRIAPLLALGTLIAVSPRALAQGEFDVSGGEVGLLPLFMQSLDAFTIVLIGGSLVAGALIVRCVLDLRGSKILPDSSLSRIDTLIDEDRWGELKEFVKKDETFASVVVGAALREQERGRDAMVDASEIAASTETARHFRKIELLNLIGNLAPLVGLAGTVWGMVIAFASLGAAGGQAGPEELSVGISKALFHTLLGLVLAIPCLLAHGVYRAMVDKICSRGIAETARIVERLPATGTPDSTTSQKKTKAG